MAVVGSKVQRTKKRIALNEKESGVRERLAIEVLCSRGRVACFKVK
jgi:hypothetical protein